MQFEGRKYDGLETDSPPRVEVKLHRAHTSFSFDEPYNPYNDTSFAPNSSILIPKSETSSDEKNIKRPPQFSDSSATLSEDIPPRNARFWMCIVALMLSSFLIVLDVVCYP